MRRTIAAVNPASQGVAAVDRTLSLFAAFRAGDDALTLAEYARRTGLYKSTVLRLLASLNRARMAERTEAGTWRLGPECARLGSLYTERFDLARILRPALATRVEATGETASFYVRDGRSRIVRYRHNSPKAVRHRSPRRSRDSTARRRRTRQFLIGRSDVVRVHVEKSCSSVLWL